MQFFYKQDLYDILNGAVLLASGGGGARKNGEAMIEAILQLTDHVACLDISEVRPDQYGVVLAGMGAPEKFIASQNHFTVAPILSFLRLTEAKRKNYPSPNPENSTDPNFTYSYIIPVETGAVAHFMSMLVAARQQVAGQETFLLDADGGGRAFPSLAMSTFAAQGMPVSPCSLVTDQLVKDGGTEVLFSINDPAKVDDLSRALLETPEFEDVAALACFSMTGAEITTSASVIPYTLSKAREIGVLLRTASDPVKALLEYFLKTDGYATLLINGVVKEIQQNTTGGFDFGTIIISNGEEDVSILNQNENIIAWSNLKTQALAMAPDLICYLDPTSALPMSNADIIQGQPIMVIGLRAPWLRTPYFEDIFGMVWKKFGYFGKYAPIETLSPSV
jgi:DUF917 family protein